MNRTFQFWWPALLVLVFSLSIGIGIYGDYGISIDEESQRDIGVQTFQYAAGNNPGFTSFELRDHGPGFEWPLMLIEHLLGLESYRDIFLARHLAGYIFFVLSMLAGYWLVHRIFGSKALATLALLMLIYHPRMFAHSFFNPKDVPAMGMYLLSIAAAYRAFTAHRAMPWLILGVICGYSTCVRLMNAIVLAPFLFFFILNIVQSDNKKAAFINELRNGLILITGFSVMLYISWPTLWENPVQSFMEVYNSYSKFNWEADVLFAGQLMRSTNLPWSYIPTWFFITMPELWLILGIIGIIIITARIIDKSTTNLEDAKARIIMLAYISFLLPILLTLALNPVLYDEWRHFFFIYPAFVILAIFALNELLQRRNKILLWGLCLAQLVLIGRFMIKYHPFQQVYFNSTVSHEENYLLHHYELDYWGTSNKHALEWLAKHTTADTIRINRDKWQWSVMFTLPFLPDSTRKRFKTEDQLKDVEYYIQFFRTYPYIMPNEEFPGATIIHEEKVLNSPIYRIVKLR